MELTGILPPHTDVLPNYLLKRVKLVILELQLVQLQLVILAKELTQLKPLKYFLPS